MNARELLIQAAYLTASILFILGLRSLTKADTARRGMQQAALGMLIAVVGTLLHHEIVSFGWIMAGLVIGSVIGYPLGVYVPMTAMPQRTAISHVFGALAATLVGIAEYYTHVREGLPLPAPLMAALGFEVMFGSLTITGSFMAFGKLQELIPGRRSPIAGRTSSTSRFSWRPRPVRIPALSSGRRTAVLRDGGAGLPLRRPAGAADRRRRHAGRDFAAELLRRAGVCGHGLCHRATTC